jgi:predicted transcriptional regulator
MALEVRSCAREIHFTLPESLWSEKREFFQSFGFANVELSGTQYRLFEHELRCAASFAEVWRRTVRKVQKLGVQFQLDGRSYDGGVLLALRPRFAEMLMDGRKKVEIRRRFHTKWIGCRVSVYATKPLGSIVGDAVIGDVVQGTAQEIWDSFGGEMGCEYTEFESYIRGCESVYAIRMTDVNPYLHPVPLSLLSTAVDAPLRVPQSYQGIAEGSSWAQATSLAPLIQGSQ